jgi:dTDP-4-dehydrorhamnose reductase
MNALIGFTGFVGSTLLKQGRFDALYRSTNIDEITDREFDLVVCAGAPGQKWLANKNPDQDRQAIDSLIGRLETVKCSKFVLISTVDVFQQPCGVDEDSPVDEEGLNAYGLHRRLLERFVQRRFADHLIVRLPGLVGPGLRKNVIFDFLNENNVDSIDARAVFQFYPMVNLWSDIERALQMGIELVHLTSEPVSVADVSLLGFGRPYRRELESRAPRYDMQTRFADLFGGRGRYQYAARESILAIRAYAQSERPSLKSAEAKA